MSQHQGNDFITKFVIALVILGLGFWFLKKSGQLDEIKSAFQALGGSASGSAGGSSPSNH